MSEPISSKTNKLTTVRPSSLPALLPLAGVALAAGATTASAQFVTFSINQTLSSTNSAIPVAFGDRSGPDATFSWNSSGFSFASDTGSNFTEGAIDQEGYFFNAGFGLKPGTDNYLHGYQAGDLIGPSSVFLANPGSSQAVLDTLHTSTWTTAGDRYLGFFITPDDGTAKQYGWIEISESYDSSAGQMDYRLLNGAYRNDGSAINAGQVSAVPEPASAGLALGAFALVAGSAVMLRRRREMLGLAQTST